MTSPSDLLSLLKATSLDMKAIEGAFDDATPAVRLQVLRQLTPKLQKNLFDAAEGQTLLLDQFLPQGTADMTEVIHEGQNTLPAFRQFQKRFCRPDSPQSKPVLWGYNHQTFSGVTGPGYFVAYDHPESGEVWIDYKMLPEGKPESWPEIIDNKAKLGRLVYANMVDRMRRVSEHVSIGRAYKAKPMSAWFTLVRQDP